MTNPNCPFFYAFHIALFRAVTGFSGNYCHLCHKSPNTPLTHAHRGKLFRFCYWSARALLQSVHLCGHLRKEAWKLCKLGCLICKLKDYDSCVDIGDFVAKVDEIRA